MLALRPRHPAPLPTMRTNEKLALTMLFCFAVGMCLTFWGAGAGKFAAFVVGLIVCYFSGAAFVGSMRDR
jgi:hypothetical protein